MQEDKTYSRSDEEFSYSGRMDQVRKFILSEIDRRDTNLAELSRALGKNHAYLQQFINRGIPASLPEGTRRSLAQMWSVPEQMLGAEQFDDVDEADESGERETVKVTGWVQAGANSQVGESVQYFPEDTNMDRVTAPAGSTPNTVALEIRGTSLGELFDRWLVFFDEVRTPVTPDLIGQICVVGLPDGRVLVKKLKRAAGGLFDLLSNTEEPIRSAEVEWAAKVKIMAPR